MKVIHTYVDNQAIIWKELLYVQYLSAILAKKHYGNISFYGDSKVCQQLKILGLPYDEINDKLYFVDLPGYGYAKASKQIIKEIKLIHESYFKTRKQLLFTFLLIDIRHDLQKVDLEFMKYLNSMMCPFVIVFTKSDKIKSDLVSEKIKLYKDSLLSYWEDLPDTFVTSAWNSKGVDEILEFVNQSIKKYTI